MKDAWVGQALPHDTLNPPQRRQQRPYECVVCSIRIYSVLCYNAMCRLGSCKCKCLLQRHVIRGVRLSIEGVLFWDLEQE